jgi:hypothetical protein
MIDLGGARRAPPTPGERKKLSCFSAVKPGKTHARSEVAPFSIAQSFMVAATTSAMDGSRLEPVSIVRISDR